MQAGAIGAYPFIPVVFYFSGIVLVETLYRLDKTNPRKLVNVYMLLKLLKMVIAAIMALIYLLVLHAPLKPFIIVFAAFYMLYILFETYVFYSFEKQIKKERK
jgi:zinc transporter ZupT